ncbi:hypothetical protein SAMN05444358_104178 [Ruegeria halocynthiae]|uniref:Uncharacterized protein n=1 Tax=Ruegeria halocynthiae TaxID=985054 RepID=A0A1H3AHE1_9RHOB|nr:hypothetical protein [Ruegeria halocynthiae]SDX29137.1 hypothetical protein SAMN05444358_104178 [Ruegeria halocynthiae]
MIRVIAFILIAIGTNASAQALRVRSGEHEGYTRIVVQVPPGTGWVLDQTQTSAHLSIAIDEATYDTTAVFNRLSGNRLKSLKQSEPGAALEMTFGCECVATAFLYRQTMVVIDITPGKFIPKAETVVPTHSFQSQNVTASDPLPIEIPATELALPLLRLSHQNFEDHLTSRILQSADREVVDLELAGVGRRHSNGFGPLLTAEELAPNLRLSSVLDDVQGLNNLAIPQLDAKPECITDSELAFETWSGTQPLPMQVSALRVGLFQEFDRVDRVQVLKLAKLYTYYGFGAEALQALALLPDTTAEQRRLSAIASVMDGLAVPASNPFEGQQRCNGFASFWALLTEGTLQPEADLNAIERSFGRLPRHLRHQIGSDLAEILVSAGRLEASRRILRAVERVLEVKPVDVTLTEARIADAAGEADTAESLLIDVISAPDAATEAPLALAHLIQKRWSDRGAISPRDLGLAASYAREFRNSELGPMMTRAHILAMALSQDFDGALKRLENAGESGEWRLSRDQVYQLLAERADDITFLRHVLGLGDSARNALAVETALSLADRLAKLGFSAQAHALADRPQDQGLRYERAQLRARAALMNDRPRQALLEIADDKSDTALQLRAQAMMQTQDFEAAALTLREAGKTEAADRYSWLAGSDDADEGVTNVFTNLARIRATLTQPIERQPGRPLADAAALLRQSANARGQIADMLEIVQAHNPN